MTTKLITTVDEMVEEFKNFKGKLGYVVTNSINFHPGYYYLLKKGQQLCDKIITIIAPTYYPGSTEGDPPTKEEINNYISSKFLEFPCDIVFPYLDILDMEIKTRMGFSDLKNNPIENTTFKDNETYKKFLTTCIFYRGYSRIGVLDNISSLMSTIKNDDIELIRLRGFSRIFQDLKLFKLFNQTEPSDETIRIENFIKSTRSVYFSELRDKKGFLYRRFDTDDLPLSEKSEIKHPYIASLDIKRFDTFQSFKEIMYDNSLPNHHYLYLKLNSSEDSVIEEATEEDYLNDNLVIGLFNDTLTKYPRENPEYVDVSGEFFIPTMTDKDYYELYPNRGMVKDTLDNELDTKIKSLADEKFSTLLEIMKKK